MAPSTDDPLGQLGDKISVTIERLLGVATRQDIDPRDRSIGQDSSERLSSELYLRTFRNDSPPE